MWSFNKWRQAPHRRVSVLLLSFVLLAVSCTSVETSEGAADDESNLETTDDSASVNSPDSGVLETSPAAKNSINLSLVTDPVADELVYACNDVVATAADLLAAFAGESQTDAEVGTRLEALGIQESQSSKWALTDNGVLIDRSPLTENPQSFLVSVGVESGVSACALRRAGFFSNRPIAWQVADDGSTQIESCVDPESVIVDSRSIGDVRVVTLFAPYDEDAGRQNCLVDGTVLLEEGVPVDALSGLTFPFVAPNPETFQALGFGSSVARPVDLAGLDLSCQVATGVAEVTVSWDALPVGVSIEIISDGQHLGAVPSVRFEDSAQVIAARIERSEVVGDVHFDGSDFDSFVDLNAPRDDVRPYEIVLNTPGSDSLSVSCGSAGIDAFGTPSAAPSGLNTEDLGAAATLFAQSSIGPYAYMTVRAVCDGCGSDDHHLEMVPGGTYNHQFSPSLDEQTGGRPGGILNPFGVHTLLDEAIQDGKDVSYTIDARIGVVIEYSIDGVGAVVSCFEVDTAPSDLRDGAACNPDWDLIS